MIRRGFGIPSMLRYSCASLQLACILTLSDPASAGQPSAGGLAPEERERYEDLDSRAMHRFTNEDLAEYLQLRAKLLANDPQRPGPADELGRLAMKALQQPFRLHADRFDLAESDCETFVERAIAMAYGSDWSGYYRLCQRLRHKNGAVSFLERNFFVLRDWVPSNAWLVENITAKLGPTDSFLYVVRPKQFFSKLQFGQDDTEQGRAKAAALSAKIAALPEKESIPVEYIARDRIPSVLPELRTGDIALVIRRCQRLYLKPWLDCDHMGVVVRTPGGMLFVHSSHPKVVSEPIVEFTQNCRSFEGMVFLRLRDTAREAAAQFANVASVAVPDPAEEDARIQALRLRRPSP